MSSHDIKLRGYEWNLIRKMYAAILTFIETKEYSWESNFDRFKTILYRKVIVESKHHHGEPRQGEGRKRFCREYNCLEGCPRNSPHPAWFGKAHLQSKEQSSTTVLAASSEINSRENIQKVIRTALTGHDLQMQKTTIVVKKGVPH